MARWARSPAWACGLLLLLAGAGGAVAADLAGSQVHAGQSVEGQASGVRLGYVLYQPPGYAADRGPYPVVYLLHGVGGSGADWFRHGGLRETADRLIRGGEIPPLVVVAPDGADGWWVDSADVAGPGNLDTAVDRDLLDEVERRYPVRRDGGGRAVAGISMGGYGALRFALRAPERYAAVAALSPALWTRIRPETPADERMQRIFRGAFGAPFQPARFARLNPLGMVDGAATAPAPPAILLMLGDRDFPALAADTRQFALRLGEAGLAARLETRVGGHDWSFWSEALPEMLRFLGRALTAR